MKEPNENATITITYGKFRDIMADKAVDLAINAYKDGGGNLALKDFVLKLTARFTARVVAELFKDTPNKEKNNVEV